jgi:4-hydroxy-tetrahydrodipicolinate reductase
VAAIVIDFSHPTLVVHLLPQAAAKKMAVVIATTGLEETQQNSYSPIESNPIFYSATCPGLQSGEDLIKNRFRVGRGFDIEIIEAHHRYKKDAPSGTALLLLQGLNEVLEPPMAPVNGRDSKDRLRTVNEIGIHAVRGGTLVGEHDVIFAGTDELVQVSHKAYSRQIFASGALKAARYIAAKRPGFYSMDKMIGEDNVVTKLYVADNEVLITIGNIPAKMSVVTSLYGSLSNDDINIDMISQTLQPGDLMTISFSLFSRDLEKAEKIIKNLIGEYPTVFYRCDSDIAKITVEGPGMEQQSGVAYKFFACLEKDQITVKAVSTSETKISAIVNSADREAASSLLKDAFLI